MKIPTGARMTSVYIEVAQVLIKLCEDSETDSDISDVEVRE